MVRQCCCRNVEIALQRCFADRVEFAVLGRLEVWIDGRPVLLGGPKQRALLALLLLDGNEVVSRDRLIDGVWGERAPESAQRSLDTYVSRLRALLGGDRIERHQPGYRLRVEPGELDLERFEALLEQGRAASAARDPAAARELLHAALERSRASKCYPPPPRSWRAWVKECLQSGVVCEFVLVTPVAHPSCF